MGYTTSEPPRAWALAVAGFVSAAATCLVACAGTPADGRPTADTETVLWGGGRCQAGADCPSGLCSIGLCLGYLAASTEEARDTVAPAIRELAAHQGGDVLERLLAESLEERSSDAFVRGRAADAFRHLPVAAALRVLPRYLDDPDEPVRFFAARALASDPRGREVLSRFLDHPAEAVRILAQRTLDGRAVRVSAGSR